MNTVKTRLKLALALGYTEQWVIKAIDKNEVDGKLTTATAIAVINAETKLSQEEILEQEPIGA